MSPAMMVDKLANALPENAAVFNDSVSTGGLLFEALAPSAQGTYYGCRGQAIGWGMGATMGVKLGSPDQPVVGVIGDGSAIMTVQHFGRRLIRTFRRYSLFAATPRTGC